MKVHCSECEKKVVSIESATAVMALELAPLCEHCARKNENAASGLTLEKHIERIVAVAGRERSRFAATLGFASFSEMVLAKRITYDARYGTAC